MCVDEEERKKKSMCEREREAINDNDECLKENPTTHLLNFPLLNKFNSIGNIIISQS